MFSFVLMSISLDARKGNLDQARHASEDNLISRSYMNTIQRPAHLMLEVLSPEDAGEYRCRVDFRKARTRNSVVFLKIISKYKLTICCRALHNCLL